MVAVALGETGHLRALGPIDAFDQSHPEASEVDAPELHARGGIVGAHIVDPVDERAALDLDVEPRPPLDRAFLAGVGDVIDLLEMCHGPASLYCG